MPDEAFIQSSYRLAVERYAEFGVDVEQALTRLRQISISIHCWQGDDVAGFETSASPIGGGLAVTGSYPGRARTVEQLRTDFEWAIKRIPGHHRFNLHANYAETGGRVVDRDAVLPEHFRGWIEWAKSNHLGLDFNSTFFAHPLAADGMTLTHPDAARRRFWVQHGIACRKIAAAMGEALGTACVHNVWIPDGYKDLPIDRVSPRQRLTESLDQLFADDHSSDILVDAVESKLFGLGSESYVAGSHEYYLGYAMARKKWLCLDAGHFHPTESIADKLSAVLPWVPGILLHVSRGVRWDSDHVVILSDELRSITEEYVRLDAIDRIRIGLDYFDASINRVAAWVIGTRCLLKGLLLALLQPINTLRSAEVSGDFTTRLALLEELKTLPFGAVWDQYCLSSNVPVGTKWLDELRIHERDVQRPRDARAS